VLGAVSSTNSDAELLARSAHGDSDAFGELAARHLDYLWFAALRILPDPGDAEEALQEALLKAHRAASTFLGGSEVRTWLRRIVVNAALDHARYRRRRPVSAMPEGFEPPERRDAVSAIETALDLDRALARLPEAQRLAVVAVDLEGLSVDEAAAALAAPPGTIKSRRARGRAALKDLLSEPGEGTR
jgi:RNA polymerase sigma-70 factor (ECF subfamily)